jgi:hypothetical protein
MLALPDEGETPRVVVVRIEVPVVELELVVVGVEVEGVALPVCCSFPSESTGEIVYQRDRFTSPEFYSVPGWTIEKST